MKENEEAVSAYYEDRYIAITFLDFDFSKILKKLNKKLYDNREWAGTIVPDGKGGLELNKIVASPLTVADHIGTDYVGTVPGDLVNEISKSPGIFMWHTHPCLSPDDRGIALPSGADLVAATDISMHGEYAAHIIFSVEGVTFIRPMDLFMINLREKKTIKERDLYTTNVLAEVASYNASRSALSEGFTYKSLAKDLNKRGIELFFFTNARGNFSRFRIKFFESRGTDFEYLIAIYKYLDEMNQKKAKK